MHSNKILVIFGPTASGKTKLACSLAKFLPMEIISADSMAIYRHMNIGTAKPTQEERQEIPYHLIDICDPHETYNTGMFVEDAAKLIQEIQGRHRIPVIVGGTALYVKSLLEGIFDGPNANWDIRKELAKESLDFLYHKLKLFDPYTSQRVSSHDSRRIIRALEVYYTTGRTISDWRRENTQPLAHYDACLVGIFWEKSILYRRIEERVDKMLIDGLIEETKQLLKWPCPLSHTASQAIGYKETILAIQEEIPMYTLADSIKMNTRHLAKKQQTWLQRFPIQWITGENLWDVIVQNVVEIWQKHCNK